jgi:hypothetical protein
MLVYVMEGRRIVEGEWEVYGVYSSETAAHADVENFQRDDAQDGVAHEYRVYHMFLRG